MIEAQCLLKQKLPHDFSHFKHLETVIRCNNSSVSGNVMINTKLDFINEVSDFPPCYHSMLIVSNHTFINVLVLRFHFCNLAVFVPSAGLFVLLFVFAVE